MSDYETEPKEGLLWKRIKQTSHNRDLIRVLPISNSIGLNHQTAKRYIKTWENMGLVERVGSNNQINLTEEGEELSDLAEYDE